MVNTAWPRALAHREEGLALGAQPAGARERLGVRGGGPGRARHGGAGCWSWRGEGLTVQTRRSQRSPRGGQRAPGARAAASSVALSATGACTAAKGRPSLSSGAQCEGTQTHSQGRVPVSPSSTAKSSSKASSSGSRRQCDALRAAPARRWRRAPEPDRSPAPAAATAPASTTRAFSAYSALPRPSGVSWRAPGCQPPQAGLHAEGRGDRLEVEVHGRS